MSENDVIKEKNIDNKRYFRCVDDLWQEFEEVVKTDALYKNKSECLRNLIRDYIKVNKIRK